MKKELIDEHDIFLLHDFCTVEECDGFIHKSAQSGYEEATITTSAGFVMRKEIRDNSRHILRQQLQTARTNQQLMRILLFQQFVNLLAERQLLEFDFVIGVDIYCHFASPSPLPTSFVYSFFRQTSREKSRIAREGKS